MAGLNPDKTGSLARGDTNVISIRSSPAFERTRHKTNRDKVAEIPRSRIESTLSIALAIGVMISLVIYLAVL